MSTNPTSGTDFTEGPWVSETTICREENGCAVIAVIPEVEREVHLGTPTRGVVAWVHQHATKSDAETLSTARLIAAAPELLDALEDMAAGWRYIRKHYGDLSGVGWDLAQTAAEAAITKARLS